MKIRAYADLHLFFDRDERIRYLEELNDIREDLLFSKDIDMLVFCGDTMHKNYNMDDEILIQIFNFVADIAKICTDKNIIFRIIKGTSSHEAKFVEILDSIYTIHPFVRAISKPEIEVIEIKGRKYSIRWLPESYGTANEYNMVCDKVFKTVTDMTFFHGSVKCFVEGQWDINVKPTQLPMSFIWEDQLLNKYTRLFSAGGHIHSSLVDHEKKIFYINSYTTHNFGEANDKGFMEFIVEDNGFTYKRIKNNKSPDYLTLTIDRIDLMEPYQIDELIKASIFRMKEYDRLRIKVNGLHTSTATANVNIIKDMTRHLNVKVVPNFTEVDNDIEEQLDYSDDNIPIVDKIHTIYVEKYGDVEKKHIEEAIQIGD